MARFPVFSLGGLNLKVSPLLQNPGELTRSVNVDSYPIGGKRKRAGYTTYLGTTPNGSAVQDLYNFSKNNGTQFWNYSFAGGQLCYSTQGTGAWTICGNGTMSASGTFTGAVVEDTLVIGDGVSATRHSTDGTSFTNTTAAPVAVSLLDYHQRIFAAGTSSNLFWSNVGTPTDWTNDSSSVLMAGPGKLNSLFKVGARDGDALIASKNSGKMFSYDEYVLNDLSAELGPTSLRSIGAIENLRIYGNRQGFYSFEGSKPELLSNAIERQIYNDDGTGIAGTAFDNLPAVGHKYRYYVSVGDVADDLTGETVSNAILTYDAQMNEWSNYSFASKPTAWLSFKDASGNQRLIFGSGDNGQCYEVSGTATSDNGATINSVFEGVLHLGSPDMDKDWRYLRAIANPGCEGHIMISVGDTFTKGKKKWVSLGDLTNGVVEHRFPSGTTGKILHWKFTESSRNARFNFYGFAVDANVVEEK